MKTKLFISILFYLCVCALIAQTDTVTKKEHLLNPKWQIGVNVNTVEQAIDFVIKERIFLYGHRKDNSYCVGINGSYRLKGDLHFRLGLKYTNNRAEETHDSREDLGYGGGGYNLDTVNARQEIIYLQPGVIYNFQYKKLDFYGGFQIVYKNYGTIAGNTTQFFYQSNGTFNEQIKYYLTSKGGYSIGIGALAGFSFNVWKGIHIGAEFSSAYSYHEVGGKVTIVKDVVNFTSPSGSYYGSYQETYQTFKGVDFSEILSSLNISYKF